MVSSVLDQEGWRPALPVHHQRYREPQGWQFLEEPQTPIREKPFTPQALLRAVVRVSA